MGGRKYNYAKEIKASNFSSEANRNMLLWERGRETNPKTSYCLCGWRYKLNQAHPKRDISHFIQRLSKDKMTDEATIATLTPRRRSHSSRKECPNAAQKLVTFTIRTTGRARLGLSWLSALAAATIVGQSKGCSPRLRFHITSVHVGEVLFLSASRLSQ